MSLKVKRYVGTVASGSGLYESMGGTLGFQLLLQCEDGATDYTIWLTEKNAKRAAEAFKVLGVDPARLSKPSEFTKIGEEIEGRELSFETEEDTYQDKTRIKVKWISAKKDSGVGSLEERAASLFGKPTPRQPGPLLDDDVPF
jgi:hypothetical protein